MTTLSKELGQILDPGQDFEGVLLGGRSRVTRGGDIHQSPGYPLAAQVRQGILNLWACPPNEIHSGSYLRMLSEPTRLHPDGNITHPRSVISPPIRFRRVEAVSQIVCEP